MEKKNKTRQKMKKAKYHFNQFHLLSYSIVFINLILKYLHRVSKFIFHLLDLLEIEKKRFFKPNRVSRVREIFILLCT